MPSQLSWQLEVEVVVAVVASDWTLRLLVILSEDGVLLAKAMEPGTETSPLREEAVLLVEGVAALRRVAFVFLVRPVVFEVALVRLFMVEVLLMALGSAFPASAARAANSASCCDFLIVEKEAPLALSWL